MTEDRESQLAKKLRSLCDEKGKEKEENLSETTEILHEFGILYQEKSPDKISLIQSAVFYNAALVRRPENKLIRQDLRRFCSHVLQEAGAEHDQTDLCEISADVKLMVEQMRKHVDDALKELRVIPGELLASELHELQELKINKVEKLQEEISIDFTNIMKFIADRCIYILGKPPCEYSVTGMGSLARREITPYSDFEHIILLEENVQKKENYEEILKYFRWLTVIFQIVVVNLGESIVRSVAAPFLNDDLSPKGDWFYDNYTTCGIKFDGMQIHACKFPLGRTRTTAEKDWTTELIKPISLMLKYLDPEEEKKNGYHLADILMKTSFVSGNRDIHDQFQRQANEMLSKGGIKSLTEIAKQVDEDLSSFNPMVKISLTNVTNICDVKRVLYRTTTLFISALGRLFKIEQNSCFDIVKKLHEVKTFTDETAHQLSYAIALACEARLKVYMLKKGQDDFYGERSYEANDNKTLDLLIELLGEQSLGDYFVITFTLHKAISSNNMLLLRKFPGKTWHKFMLFWNLDLKKRFFFEWESLQIERNLLEESYDANCEDLFILYTVAKMNRRCEKNEEALQVFEMIINLSIKNKSIFDDQEINLIFPILKADSLKEKAQCMLVLNRHKEVNEFIPKAATLTSELDLSDDDRALNLGTLYFHAGQSSELLGRFGDAIINFEKGLLNLNRSISPFRRNYIVRCHIGIAFSQYRLGSLTETIQHLTKAYDLHFNASIEMKVICDCCNALYASHMTLNQPIKAKYFLEEELKFRLRFCSLEDQSTDEDILICRERLQLFDSISENPNEDDSENANTTL